MKWFLNHLQLALFRSNLKNVILQDIIITVGEMPEHKEMVTILKVRIKG